MRLSYLRSGTRRENSRTGEQLPAGTDVAVEVLDVPLSRITRVDFLGSLDLGAV